MSARLEVRLDVYTPARGTIVRIVARNPRTGERQEEIGAALYTEGDLWSVRRGVRTAINRALRAMDATNPVRWGVIAAEKLLACEYPREVVKIRVWFDVSEIGDRSGELSERLNATK